MTLLGRPVSCRRFERLTSESFDRELLPDEADFLRSHRLKCSACRCEEEQGALALNMLRQSALDADSDDAFDRRVIRRVKSQTVREGFRYWSPVALGATLAMVGLLAAMQVALQSDSLPERRSKVGEAMRTETGFPTVPELSATPKLEP